MRLYTSEKCSPCKDLEKRFKKEGIEFKEVSLDKKKGLATAIANGINRIPTIIIDGEKVTGLKNIKEELREKGVLK